MHKTILTAVALAGTAFLVSTRCGLDSLTVDLCILGGFLGAEVFAFSRSTASDVGFAVGIATLLLGFVLSPTVRRVRAKQVIGLATGLRLVTWDAVACATVTIGTWQIVQSRTFDLATTKWISCADGLAMLALDLAALILHEVSTEHVVHGSRSPRASRRTRGPHLPSSRSPR